MKALIVGRHIPDLGDSKIEVVGQENIMFSLDRIETASQVRGLADSARKVGAEVVLLQNAPMIVVAALLDIVRSDGVLQLGSEACGRGD